VEQDKDTKAREKPKMTPTSTKLKTKRSLEDNFFTRFIDVHSPFILNSCVRAYFHYKNNKTSQELQREF
jgi:hypothetical protein